MLWWYSCNATRAATRYELVPRGGWRRGRLAAESRVLHASGRRNRDRGSLVLLLALWAAPVRSRALPPWSPITQRQTARSRDTPSPLAAPGAPGFPQSVARREITAAHVTCGGHMSAFLFALGLKTPLCPGVPDKRNHGGFGIGPRWAALGTHRAGLST